MGGILNLSLVCRLFILSNYKMKIDENQLQIGNNHKD